MTNYKSLNFILFREVKYIITNLTSDFYKCLKHSSLTRRFGVPLTPRPVISSTFPVIGNSL